MDLFKDWSLKSLLEASSVLAAGVYALGWIFVAPFFARFSVTPEEVGFTFAYLLVRVGLLFIAFAVIVALVVWSLNKLATLSGGRQVSFSTDSVWQVVAVLAVVFVLFTVWSNPSGAASAGWLIALASGILGYVFAIRSRRLRNKAGEEEEEERSQAVLAQEETRESLSPGATHGRAADSGPVAAGDEDDESWRQTISSSPQSLFRFLSYGFGALAIAILVAVPFYAGSRYADQIQDGKELRAPILPGILNVRRVQATSSDDQPISPRLGSSKCVHLLGSSSGTLVLYDYKSDSVVRVPEARVSLEDPCS